MKYKKSLKTCTTKELAILLSSGICGDEYKQVLVEYSTRPECEKRHKKPSDRYKSNHKKCSRINLNDVNEDNVKKLRFYELKLLIPRSNGVKYKLLSKEYARRIHLLDKLHQV